MPITTLLAVLILHKRSHRRRGVGTALALAGVLLVIWRPGFAMSAGLPFVLGAAAAGSLGAIPRMASSG